MGDGSVVNNYESFSSSGTDDPTRHFFDNAYSASWYRGEDQPLIYTWWSPDVIRATSASSTYWRPWLENPYSSNDDIALLNKLGDAVRGSSFQGGIAAAEGRKTASMVGDALVNLVGAARALKRGDVSAAARSLGVNPKRSIVGDLSTGWLQLQYGWLPLLKDIHAADDAAGRIRTPLPAAHKTRAHKSAKVVETASDGKTYNTVAVRKVQKQYIATFSENISLPAQIGLTDPVGVAWELVPYSFVVDWFLPVGNYLDAHNTVHLVHNVPITMSTKDVSTSITNYYRSAKEGDEYLLSRNPLNSGTTRIEIGSFNRAVNQQISSALSLPEFKPWSKSLSGLHVANGLALLANAFGR